MNIIIPTLGGNRGFKVPRYLIKINNEYIIQNIVKNLNFNAKFIFIISHKDKKIYNVHKILKKIKPNCKIIVVKKKTKGILQSLLLAEKYFNKKKIIISNSDQLIDLDKKKLLSIIKNKDNFGCILSYFPKDKSHCFLKCKSGKIIFAAERKKVSNIAAAGLYYFQNGLELKKSMKKVIKNKITHNNLYYMSSVLNEIIKKNKKIVHHKIKKMIPLGSPIEFKRFIKKKNLNLSNFSDII
jgi:dTDP-glucose pyrophosphorylase